MKHIEVAQNSLEWLLARAGVLTASEASSIVTPKWKIRDGEMPDTLLCRKLAERWVGPLPGFNTLDMEFGKIMEEEARPWLAMHLNQDIKQVGLITTDDGKCGCSPDGVIDGKIGVEIKCPEPTNHVKYLRNGELPDQYLAQVHFSLWVTGWDEWIFCSYRRRFPNLVLRIKRDEEIIKTIDQAASEFIDDLDAEYEKLCKLNGGSPRKAVVAEPVKQPQSDDIIP